MDAALSDHEVDWLCLYPAMESQSRTEEPVACNECTDTWSFEHHESTSNFLKPKPSNNMPWLEYAADLQNEFFATNGGKIQSGISTTVSPQLLDFSTDTGYIPVGHTAMHPSDQCGWHRTTSNKDMGYLRTAEVSLCNGVMDCSQIGLQCELSAQYKYDIVPHWNDSVGQRGPRSSTLVTGHGIDVQPNESSFTIQSPSALFKQNANQEIAAPLHEHVSSQTTAPTRSFSSSSSICAVRATGSPQVFTFHCTFPRCRQRVFSRWSDFNRHYNGAHALEKTKFWCPISGCDRSERGNRPFPRKDKMRDHAAKMHGIEN